MIVEGRRARVVLQDSCHLRNGLGVYAGPRALITAVADLVAVPVRTPAAQPRGTCPLLGPRDSRRLLEPKLDAIENADLAYVVAVNPGCLPQLQTGLGRRSSRVRAIHLVDLLAAAAVGAPLPHSVR